MAELLKDRDTAHGHRDLLCRSGPASTRPPRGARCVDQIAKLERELAALFASAYPRQGLDWQVRSPGGPRAAGRSATSRQLRDALADRVEETRRSLRDRAYVEQKNRERIEELIAEPARFKWVRISNADIGEPGCKFWHSRPRLGLIGMLMGWWRVRISSGCP